MSGNDSRPFRHNQPPILGGQPIPMIGAMSAAYESVVQFRSDFLFEQLQRSFEDEPLRFPPHATLPTPLSALPQEIRERAEQHTPTGPVETEMPNLTELNFPDRFPPSPELELSDYLVVELLVRMLSLHRGFSPQRDQLSGRLDWTVSILAVQSETEQSYQRRLVFHQRLMRDVAQRLTSQGQSLTEIDRVLGALDANRPEPVTRRFPIFEGRHQSPCQIGKLTLRSRPTTRLMLTLLASDGAVISSDPLLAAFESVHLARTVADALEVARAGDDLRVSPLVSPFGARALPSLAPSNLEVHLVATGSNDAIHQVASICFDRVPEAFGNPADVQPFVGGSNFAYLISESLIVAGAFKNFETTPKQMFTTLNAALEFEDGSERQGIAEAVISVKSLDVMTLDLGEGGARADGLTTKFQLRYEVRRVVDEDDIEIEVPEELAVVEQALEIRNRVFPPFDFEEPSSPSVGRFFREMGEELLMHMYVPFIDRDRYRLSGMYGHASAPVGVVMTRASLDDQRPRPRPGRDLMGRPIRRGAPIPPLPSLEGGAVP